MIPVVTWGRYLTMMGYFPKFSHVHQIIKFQVCLQILSLIACCSPADTLALEQSKWNELRQTSSLENQQLCKAKKSWVGGNLHLIAARNTAKWWWLSSAAKFPPFRPLFAAIRSTLILTLPPACVPVCLWDQTTEREWYDFTLFLFLAQNLIHCFSVFSSILAQVYLTFPFESSATSSKISISLRKWKLHHLRRVSIKLEGRRNGNVEIENPSSGKQNTKRKKGKWKLEKKKIPALENKIQKERKY